MIQHSLFFSSPSDGYLRCLQIFIIINIPIYVSCCTCTRISLGVWEGSCRVIRNENVQFQNIKMNCFPKLLYQFKLPMTRSKRYSRRYAARDIIRLLCLPVENLQNHCLHLFFYIFIVHSVFSCEMLVHVYIFYHFLFIVCNLWQMSKYVNTFQHTIFNPGTLSYGDTFSKCA